MEKFLALISSAALDSYGSVPVTKAKLFDSKEEAELWFKTAREGAGWMEEYSIIPLGDLLAGNEFSSW